MSAKEIIAQIDALPPKERDIVFEHVHRLEEALEVGTHDFYKE